MSADDTDDPTGASQDPAVESDVAAEPAQAPEAEVEAQEVAAEEVEADEIEQLDEAPDDLGEAEAGAEGEGAGADAEAAVQPELEHGVPVTRPRGEVVLHPDRERYPELVAQLRAAGYWTCVDLCGVDNLGNDGDRGLPPGTAAERFEVVAVLRNHAERSTVRVRVQVPEDDPVVPSLFALHPGTENPEREAWDMFGIRFEGHPGLTRILMPDEWRGHPLRKDFAVGRIPVQFKGVRSAR